MTVDLRFEGDPEGLFQHLNTLERVNFWRYLGVLHIGTGAEVARRWEEAVANVKPWWQEGEPPPWLPSKLRAR